MPQLYRQKFIDARAEELLSSEIRKNAVATDRLLVLLMALQWIGAIVAAGVISPRTWLGATSSPHIHVNMAIWLGAAVSLPPIWVGLRYSGQPTARHVLAVAQMLWSILLIHLSGGRIETHFHIFGSLAFLAVYRDWRVLVTATAVVAADHFVRGMWFSQSVFGIVDASPYRWLEHVAWVFFEDIVLFYSCVHGRHDLRTICQRQAELERTNEQIEDTVRNRTADLELACDELEKQIEERCRAEREREVLNKQLIEASRQAGMAEIATGVLHNVGNVLNSVTVSCNMLLDCVHSSKLPGLSKVLELIDQHTSDLGEFFNSKKGQKVPTYLRQLYARLEEEHVESCKEATSLRNNIEHIAEIVGMQQNHARGGGFREELDLEEVLESAIRINGAAFHRHGVQVVRELDEDLPSLVSDRHRLMQILINLIGNAKQAVTASHRDDKTVTLRISSLEEGSVTLDVIDNGVGIASENLDKIFSHGFTTKPDGHGFGLHSSANAATEIGGTLSASSEGVGKGAKFRLTVPLTFHEHERADAEDLQLIGKVESC